jgi:GDP-L-fucose synthase
MAKQKIINFYKNKKILVTGGSGLIGMPLVERLISYGAKVSVVSLDDKPKIKGNFSFFKSDLREFKNCLSLCKSKDIVFHLAGIKGSPLMTAKKPASFLVPTVTFTFNMMEAARRCKVKQFLLASSIGVYAPARVFKEDSVWKTFPSKNDRFAGWAKRLCELQAESYKIQYNWNCISIIRPANVYGPYDNFDTKNAMVIPSLIKKIIKSKKKLDVWGDGSPIRDFIFSEDVADGMILAVYKKINYPINIGSGQGVTIKSLVETIVKVSNKNKLKINWQKNKPSGDRKRLMDLTKAKAIGFSPKISLREGIEKTIKWFLKNEFKNKRYNSFTEKS